MFKHTTTAAVVVASMLALLLTPLHALPAAPSPAQVPAERVGGHAATHGQAEAADASIGATQDVVTVHMSHSSPLEGRPTGAAGWAGSYVVSRDSQCDQEQCCCLVPCAVFTVVATSATTATLEAPVRGVGCVELDGVQVGDDGSSILVAQLSFDAADPNRGTGVSDGTTYTIDRAGNVVNIVEASRQACDGIAVCVDGACYDATQPATTGCGGSGNGGAVSWAGAYTVVADNVCDPAKCCCFGACDDVIITATSTQHATLSAPVMGQCGAVTTVEVDLLFTNESVATRCVGTYNGHDFSMHRGLYNNTVVISAAGAPECNGRMVCDGGHCFTANTGITSGCGTGSHSGTGLPASWYDRHEVLTWAMVAAGVIFLAGGSALYIMACRPDANDLRRRGTASINSSERPSRYTHGVGSGRGSVRLTSGRAGAGGLDKEPLLKGTPGVLPNEGSTAYGRPSPGYAYDPENPTSGRVDAAGAGVLGSSAPMRPGAGAGERSASAGVAPASTRRLDPSRDRRRPKSARSSVRSVGGGSTRGAGGDDDGASVTSRTSRASKASRTSGISVSSPRAHVSAAEAREFCGRCGSKLPRNSRAGRGKCEACGHDWLFSSTGSAVGTL